MKDRKQDHLNLSLGQDVTTESTNGFERYRLRHQALPELDLNDISPSTTFLNSDQEFGFPLMISGMVGGNPKSQDLNQRLARVAEDYSLPLGVGSQRIAIENSKLEDSFRVVREKAPNTFIIANLGAVQLNYGYGIEEAKRAVDMIDANALALHLNPVQEAIQPEGDTNFKGLLTKIERVCYELEVPVIVKEVGSGISGSIALKLEKAGVSALDLQGLGGTSFAKIEMIRSDKDYCSELENWGLPTSQCLEQCSQEVSIPLIASGGIRNGIQILKAIALGADLAAIALPLLKSANRSESALRRHLDKIKQELRLGMFLTGSSEVSQVSQDKIKQAWP